MRQLKGVRIRMFRKRGSGPDRSAALDQYRRRASVYDLELLLFEPVRRQALAWLAPRPGHPRSMLKPRHRPELRGLASRRRLARAHHRRRAEP